jgi:hypothetical protein
MHIGRIHTNSKESVVLMKQGTKGEAKDLEAKAGIKLGR